MRRYGWILCWSLAFTTGSAFGADEPCELRLTWRQRWFITVTLPKVVSRLRQRPFQLANLEAVIELARPEKLGFFRVSERLLPWISSFPIEAREALLRWFGEVPDPTMEHRLLTFLRRQRNTLLKKQLHLFLLERGLRRGLSPQVVAYLEGLGFEDVEELALAEYAADSGLLQSITVAGQLERYRVQLRRALDHKFLDQSLEEALTEAAAGEASKLEHLIRGSALGVAGLNGYRDPQVRRVASSLLSQEGRRFSSPLVQGLWVLLSHRIVFGLEHQDRGQRLTRPRFVDTAIAALPIYLRFLQKRPELWTEDFWQEFQALRQALPAGLFARPDLKQALLARWFDPQLSREELLALPDFDFSLWETPRLRTQSNPAKP